MASIGVAIVGCGNVASGHLAAWRRIPSAKVLAVCDANRTVAEKAAREWAVPKSFTSPSELTKLDEITLWDICTPIQTHKDLANQAMVSGLDVLIEKPMTITSKEAEEIVECQKTTGRKAGVIHNWLFEPPLLKAKAIVDRGSIGEIIGAHMAVLHTKEESMISNKNHWSHKLPGGRFSEMLIHPIYVLRSFLGDIRTASVEVSKVGGYEWMKYDELSAIFKAGEKKLASAHISFNAPRNSIYIDLLGRQGILRLDVIAATVIFLPATKMERFSKAVDSFRQAGQLSVSTAKNALRILSGQWRDGHETCIRLFAESISKGGQPPVTVQEGYEVVKVLEDIYRRID